jgi:HEAT repeat protein
MRTMTASALLVLAAAGARAGEPPGTKPPPANEPRFWTDDELARIDRGLHVLNLDRKDLGFQKRPIDDAFRLPVVNRILDDPLSVGDDAQAWDAAARGEDPVLGLLNRACKTLGADRGVFYGGSWRTTDPAGIPESVRGPLESVLRQASGLASASRGLQRDLGDRADAVLLQAFRTQVEPPGGSGARPPFDDEAFRAALIDSRSNERFAPPARDLLHKVGKLVVALRALPRGAWEVPTAGVRLRWGQVVVSGTGDDVHDEGDDVVLVIDLGGNDTWLHGASATPKRPVSVCIDMGGDDRYVGRNDFSFGGAWGGVAIQWDAGGNDLYDAGNCSLGAGILGVGVLVDEGGDDVYRCKDFGQGAGAFGIGVLWDGGGNDLRHVDKYGQGYGSTWGCGVLADLGGHDVYDAGGAHSDAPLHRDRTESMSQGFGMGMRPDASGGVGVLVDVAGNDRYVADVYGQGASYWYSLGLLIDDDGNDAYVLGHYGQGAGIHLSAGMLLDRAGQDLYFTEYGVGIGGAHDLSVGVLVDRGGDDHYVGSGGSQGGALSNSVALLLDDGGDDEYTAARPGSSHGSAAPARDTGGIGLLLDASGNDHYSESTRDGGVWTSGLLGAGLDEPTPPAAPAADPMAAAITPEAAKAAVDRDGTVPGPDGKPVDDLDRLWAIASRWQVGDERVIGPIARARLVAMGVPALERAVSRLGTKDGLEFEAAQALLGAFPRADVVPRLLGATESKEAPVRKGALRVLAALAPPEAAPRLEAMLGDEAVRAQVLRALAALKKAPPAVAALLRAPMELDGVAAAVCLGATGGKEAIDALVGALSPSTPFLVRVAAGNALAARGGDAVPALYLASAQEGDVRTRRSALRALGGTRSADAARSIAYGLVDTDPWVRLSARLAGEALVKDLSKAEGSALAAALAEAAAKETDPLLKRLR